MRSYDKSYKQMKEALKIKPTGTGVETLKTKLTGAGVVYKLVSKTRPSFAALSSLPEY